MARGKQRLTPKQQAQLEFVAETERSYRDGREKIRIQAERWKQEQMAELTLKREEAIYEAIRMGIPKSRIHTEGLGTTSPTYVYDVERRWDEKREDLAVEMPEKPEPKYSLGYVHFKNDENIAAWLIDSEKPTETPAPDNSVVRDGWFAMYRRKDGKVSLRHDLGLDMQRFEEYLESVWDEIPNTEQEED